MSELNIYQRINAVQKSVQYVQKDITVTGGGTYKAVSHDMVQAVLRPHMVANGIVLVVRQVSGEMLQTRDKEAGVPMHLYSGCYEVDFVNIDSPDDRFTAVVSAHANDMGDKAPGKSMSYAIKYALLKTFGLETGESDESRLYEAPQYTDIQKE